MAESLSVFRKAKKLKKDIASAYKPRLSIACPSFMFALPRMQEFRQALGITAAIAVFIIPDTTAMRQTFLCEVYDFPPNVRILVKLTSQCENSSPPYFQCYFQQQGGSREPRAELGIEQEQTGFSSLFPASFGQ